MREKRRASSARNTPRSNDILRPQRSALEEACPVLAGFEVEGAAETVKQAYSQAEWSEIENAPQLRDGACLTSQALALPMRYAPRVPRSGTARSAASPGP